MKQALIVFLGGGLGSALRYGVSKMLNAVVPSFPFGTMIVNIIGSLVIGVLLGLSMKENGVEENTLLFLAVGLCGGFTTFSAFAYENFTFLKHGDLGNFVLYTLGSLLIGIFAVVAGVWLAKFF